MEDERSARKVLAQMAHEDTVRALARATAKSGRSARRTRRLVK